MMFVNVSFKDCTFVGNSGFGWILSPSMLNGSSRDLSIVIENITVTGMITSNLLSLVMYGVYSTVCL